MLKSLFGRPLLCVYARSDQIFWSIYRLLRQGSPNDPVVLVCGLQRPECPALK
jgi:hypothetical protein